MRSQGLRTQFWRPPTDVYETEDAFIVRVEIAGMKANDFAISLENRLLVVRGARPDQPERRAYHQMEIHFGEFSTEVELSSAVDVDKIEAVYRDGFLRITLPKTRPHQVTVQDEE
jgi:HSP20 family protein